VDPDIVVVVGDPSRGIVAVAEAARADRPSEVLDTVDDRNVSAEASIEVAVEMELAPTVVVEGLGDIHLTCRRRFATWEQKSKDIRLAVAHVEEVACQLGLGRLPKIPSSAFVHLCHSKEELSRNSSSEIFQAGQTQICLKRRHLAGNLTRGRSRWGGRRWIFPAGILP
jgi:hypothetical protein